MARDTILIARRELARLFGSPVAYVVVVLFLLLSGAMFWLPYFEEVSPLSMRSYFVQASLLCSFFVPALTMSAIAGEARAGTLAMMMTLPVRARAIVLGKFLASVVVIAASLSATLVYPVLLSWLGSRQGVALDLGAVASGYVGVFMLCTAYAGVGVLASSVTRDQVVAILASFSICFSLHMVGQVAQLLGSSGASHVVLDAISSLHHVEAASRGVWAMSDVLYFVSIAAGALSCAAYAVGRARRRRPGWPLALALIGLVALNALVVRHDARLDLTSEGLYTLHESSERVLDAIDDRVEVDVYLSSDLPPPLHETEARVEDLLDEYLAASNGRLRVTMHEVQRIDDEVAAEAAERGCREVALGARRADVVSVRPVYKCAVIRRGERVHVIDDLRLTGEEEEDTVEFWLTRGIAEVVRDGRARRVGFLLGRGGPADREGFVTSAGEVFRRVYGGAIEPVGVDADSLKSPRALDGLDGLVVLDVTSRLEEDAVESIEAFLRQGGAVGWYQSATALDVRTIEELSREFGEPSRQPNVRRVVKTGLEPLAARYGIEHRKDVVLDEERAVRVRLDTLRGRGVEAQSPAIFQIPELTRGITFLSGKPFVVLPMPSTLGVRDVEGVRVRALASTAKSAERFDEVPRAPNYEALVSMVERGNGERGEHVVMAAAEGKFAKVSDKEGRLLVVGSGDFLIPRSSTGYDAQLADKGQQLFFESVEWLIGQEGFETVRSRRQPAYLGRVDSALRWRVQIVSVLLPPILFLLLGYGVRLWRATRKRRIAERFEDKRREDDARE